MARLQRKKKPGTRSSRRSDEGVDSGSAAGTQAVAGRRASAGVESGGENRRKQTTVSRKTPVSLTKKQVVREKDGYLQKSMQFLREVKVELKKVTWPSRKQTLGSTAVVIVLVILIAIFLGVVDVGLSGIFRSVLR